METMMREMMEQQRVSLLGEIRSQGNLTSGSSSSSTQQAREPVVRNLATEFFSLVKMLMNKMVETSFISRQLQMTQHLLVFCLVD
jgi:hypothetical protein